MIPERKNDRYQNEKARSRWRLIRELLKSGRSAADENPISVRRFSSFGLYTSTSCDDFENADAEAVWLNYSCIELPDILIQIRHLKESFSPSDLKGFNNTGNICIWPSEEILAYYCVKNVHLFSKQTICEVGGGMTCLAGIFVAACGDLNEVLVTDGNLKSVINTNRIVEANRNRFRATKVAAKVLRWEMYSNLEGLKHKFDSVICADCFFFDDCQKDLVQLLCGLLKPKGQVISFAPLRGKTLARFLELAAGSFEVHHSSHYDETITNLHLKFQTQGTSVYDDDIHYPHLVRLIKR